MTKLAPLLTMLLTALLSSAEPTEVVVTSTADGSAQPAVWFVPPDADTPTPLLVHLHTWSGDHQQADPRDGFLAEARARGWAFIHPEFRGPNTRPEACGSELARSDILDAVEFAHRNARIDTDRVYLAGVSGGGHMALIMAAEAPRVWAGVAAAVPPTDLAAWHDQNGDDGRYARHLEAVCGGRPSGARLETLAWNDDAASRVDAQYRARSPLALLHRAAGVPIFISAGIRDGHEGSVPVSHAIRAFDALAIANAQPHAAFGDSVTRAVTAEAAVPDALAWRGEPLPAGHTREILLRRTAGPAELVLFDGAHEGDHAAMVRWLSLQVRPSPLPRPSPAARRLLVLGDSNAAASGAWPAVLRSMRPEWDIVNRSLPGATIGFDNLGDRRLNTLARLGDIVAELRTGPRFDLVIVALGTNDAKAVFAGRQDEAATNLGELLDRLRGIDGARLGGPETLVLLPPPAWRDDKLEDKYAGAADRIADHAAVFTRIARDAGARVVDLHDHFLADADALRDGIHLTPKAQWETARLIDAAIADGAAAAE